MMSSVGDNELAAGRRAKALNLIQSACSIAQDDIS